MVAIYVIDEVLSGVRDLARLHEGALEYVRSTVAKVTAQGAVGGGASRSAPPSTDSRMPRNRP